MKVALDTETTGPDFFHGCRPFFVSTCNDSGDILWWEWPVDPHTRFPTIPEKDIKEIQEYLDSADTLILHNTKFDYRALESIGINIKGFWEKTHDTLMMSHLHNSLEEHGLKYLSLKYLDILDSDQKDLIETVNAARRLARSYNLKARKSLKKFISEKDQYPLSPLLLELIAEYEDGDLEAVPFILKHLEEAGYDVPKPWRIANPDDPHFPGLTRSPNSGWAVLDMWLPKACYEAGLTTDEKFSQVCSTYALTDAERTLALFNLFTQRLKEENLYEIYEKQLPLLEAVYSMETSGVTINPARLKSSIKANQKAITSFQKTAMDAIGIESLNFNSGPQMCQVLFSDLGLPVTKKAKGGGPSTDKTVIDTLLTLTDRGSDEHTFLLNHKAAKRSKSITQYLQGYDAAAFRFNMEYENEFYRYCRIHPSFNPTGTNTTRFSSSNPNAQNISKANEPCMWCGGDGCKYCKYTGKTDRNIRKVFEPLPGRMWISADYSNIEMRLFARLAEEEGLIREFEEGEGSFHMFMSKVLLGKEADKPGFKKTDRYRDIKSGNFAFLFGGSPRKVNQTYKIPNAYEVIMTKLKNVGAFLEDSIKQVEQNGYVTTLGGYRLYVNQAAPYKGANYRVQGSAGIAMKSAIMRCHEYITGNAKNLGINMIMTIHDELIFDCPLLPEEETLELARNIQYLMEKSGDDFGFPLPAEPELHYENWAEGVEV